MRFLAALLLLATLGGCTPEATIAWVWFHHGATPDEQREAIDIAWCESRFDEDVRNSTGHVSWFQLSPIHRARAEAMGITWEQASTSGLHNATVAAALWVEQGFTPWRACR